MSASGWKVVLDCTRAEAEAAELEGVALAAEEVEGERWRLEAYLAEPPSPELLEQLAALTAGTAASRVERLLLADWVTLSQSAVQPVEAGRFLVYTRAHRWALKPHHIGINIEAAQAFGTGQHDTTQGCLLAIDRAARRAGPARVLDLGTGTGVLAIAAAKRWRCAAVTASDIDAVAVAVARHNVRVNGIAPGRIELLTARGLRHRRLRGRQWDLVLANILAAPLVAVAGPIAAAVAPGGRLVLAGLLTPQAQRVVAAYLARGLALAHRPRRAGWPVLEFRRRLRHGTRETGAAARPA